jgi:hypothetical protein
VAHGDLDDDASGLIAPVDADGVGIAIVGTCVWAVAAIVLWWGFWPQLQRTGAEWWLWVCLVGAGLGPIGIAYALRRRAAYKKHAQRGGSSPHARESRA